jgi:hypothetical protein
LLKMKKANPTMRELRALAQDRLGERAAGLKTRAELLAALGLDAPRRPSREIPAVATPASAPLVLKDFFRRG